MIFGIITIDYIKKTNIIKEGRMQGGVTMALTVKDIIQLEGLRNMKPIAGLGGLNRQVVTIGIADHEFASFADPSERDVFEPNSIVLTSLLFAKDEPEQILSAVEYFYQTSAAAFAYKVSVFDELPQEVMDFANDHVSAAKGKAG